MVYSIFVQVGLGLTPLEAALTGVAWPLGISIAAGASIQLAPRIGRPLLSLGGLLLALGMGALIGALRLAGTDITPWHLVPGMVLGGSGTGMITPTSD